MADSVAALKVTLGLDAAEYTRGLSKAEIQAQQFARNTRTAIESIGKVLGGLAIADLLYENAKAITAEASALDSLAASTGSSVEELSRLTNVAKIAGSGIGELQGLLLSLGNSMGNTDKQSERVKKTLELLGVTTKDPARAMEELAKKFDQYADGANKIALATAIFGGQAQQALAIMKALTEQQDIAATVTREQAKAAADLETEMRKLSVESKKFSELVLSAVVPALGDMVREFREGIQFAGGFFNALRLFGSLSPFDKPLEGISKLRKEIAELEAARPKAGLYGQGEFAEIDGMIADRRKQIAYLESQARAQFKANPEDTNVRDILMRRKPEAPPPPPPPARGGGQTLKEQTTDAERLIQTLQKQIVAQQDLNKVEEIELEIARLQKDAKSGLTAEREAQLRVLAREIDAGKEADRVAKELKKSQEEIAKEKAKFVEATRKSVEATEREAAGIRQGNESIREQIIALQGGQTALDDYLASKREALAVSKEFEAAQLLAAGGSVEEAKAIRDVAKALRETSGAVADFRIAEKMAEEARKMQEVKNMFSDALVDPLTDFVTGAKSAKDAFRDLVNDITRQLARLASQNVANKLFGGNSSGGADVFGMFAKMLAGMASGGGGVPGVGFSGGGFGEHFSTGGVSRGGMAMVGEMGPELVDLPAGARIRPNNQVRTSDVGARISIVQNIDRNADTRAHRQAALDAFSVASGAARRR